MMSSFHAARLCGVDRHRASWSEGDDAWISGDTDAQAMRPGLQ